jgi:hypothetical protein
MRGLWITAIWIACCTGALGDDYRIQATKKTADTRKSATQDLPRGRSHAVTEDVYYAFTLRRMNPNLPERAVVEWVVLKEAVDGRLLLGTRGRKEIDMPFGKEIELKTDTVTLRGRTWTSGRAGTVEEEVHGYGLRVLNDEGDILAEKYEPDSLEERVEWKTASDEREEDGDRDDRRQRPPRRRPWRRRPRP